MYRLRNMVRRSFATVCVVALVDFHAFVGMKTHVRRYKLQSRNAACVDRFGAMAQSVLNVNGYDANVTRVAVELAQREAATEAASKYRLLQLKYLSVSSRFWLEKMFIDFAAFLQTTHLPSIPYSNSGINKILANNPRLWQAFVARENISLEFPLNVSFPQVSQSLLYGRLSEQVHEPPGLVVLRLWDDTEYTGEVYLLRDLGAHYSRKLGIVAEPLDLSRALADLMKPDRRQ